jgi:hypothetical protein
LSNSARNTNNYLPRPLAAQNHLGRTESESNGLFQIKKCGEEVPPSAADSRNEFDLLQAHQYQEMAEKESVELG